MSYYVDSNGNVRKVLTIIKTGSKKATDYDISVSTTNVTAAINNTSIIREKSSVVLVFTANAGYGLPASVSVTGATSSWDISTGQLTISNPTDNVSVTIAGVLNTRWRMRDKYEYSYFSQLPSIVVYTNRNGYGFLNVDVEFYDANGNKITDSGFYAYNYYSYGNRYYFEIGRKSVFYGASTTTMTLSSAYSSPFEFTITGGADAENPTLLAWLQTYATPVSNNQ